MQGPPVPVFHRASIAHPPTSAVVRRGVDNNLSCRTIPLRFAEIRQEHIPKLRTRVRFPSPALPFLLVKAGVRLQLVPAVGAAWHIDGTSAGVRCRPSPVADCPPRPLRTPSSALAIPLPRRRRCPGRNSPPRAVQVEWLGR